MKIDLGLLDYKPFLKIRENASQKQEVFDPVRKKYVRLLPEELVRQLIIQYLNRSKDINFVKINVEKQIKLNQLKKRFDIIVYGDNYEALLLIECKSFKHKLDQNALDQVARYNFILEVPYLMITNGRESYICKMDYESKSFEFIDFFPLNLKEPKKP